MRMAGVPYAVATYPIPPLAPAPVAEAKAEFDSIAARFADTKGELQDAKDALAEAKAADIRAVVNAAEKGEEVTDPQANARDVEARIADLEVQLHGLDIATDEAGNRLAQAIATHRDKWLQRLADAEAYAAARFDQAVAEAQAALTDLRPTRGAVSWLDMFDTGLAQGGQYPPFAGGRLRVKSRIGTVRGEFDPTALLEAAAKVTEAPARAKVATHA